MSKKSDRIQQELIAAIRVLQNPASNPAQNYLTTSAIGDSGGAKGAAGAVGGAYLSRPPAAPAGI